MGLLDFLAKETTCAWCGQPGARSLLGKLQCPNRECVKFDQRHLDTQQARGNFAALTTGMNESYMTSQYGADCIPIRYLNHRGEQRTYFGDARTLRRRGNYVSLCLFPSKLRAAFAIARIQNSASLEKFPKAARELSDSARPTQVERQVLGFHRRHKSTSPLYESIRTKYPGE